MRNKSILTLSLLLLLAACSQESGVEEKKAKLEEYQAQVKDLNKKIASLEEEISKEDSSYSTEATAASQGKAILVSTKDMKQQEFVHKIDVRGSVASKKNVLISSQISGEIEAVKVVEGQRVSKGQVLIMLDADIIRNNIAELKTSLELADAVYKRQANLWDKNIGTEIQYLEAKNKKQSLERQLATAQSQLDQAIIRAPFSGSVDDIHAKEGEIASPGMELVRMVSHESMYIKADVSERYAGDFKKGDEVELYFPVQDKRFSSKVSFLSEVINQDNRTFSLEVQLPKLDFKAKPNQVVVMKLTDYKTKEAMVVPTEIVLSDQEGKYLFVTDKREQNAVAKKQHVEAGKSYDGNTEIIKGLSNNDQVITEGYRDVSDGVLIKTTDQSTETAKL